MNLISTIIGIGLFALTVGAGISYINPGAQASAETAAVVTAGFQGLAQAYQSRQMTGAAPPDAASWERALFPAYGFEPRPPAGTTWSYGTTAAGRWFCLTAATATPQVRGAFALVAKRYSSAAFRVSGRCGESEMAPSASGGLSTSASGGPGTSTSGGPGTSTSGAGLSATLWVAREGP